MATSSDKTVQMSEAQKDVSSKKSFPFSKEPSRKLSKKGKDSPNGLQQGKADDAGVTAKSPANPGATTTAVATSSNEPGKFFRPVVRASGSAKQYS